MAFIDSTQNSSRYNQDLLIMEGARHTILEERRKDML